MKDFNEVACFTKVAQERSITAAAKSLGIPKSTVSRKLAALEKRLGVTLMKRTTRQIQLTEAGEAYFLSSSRAITELENAEAEIGSRTESVSGLLRVTAPVEFAVGPMIKLFAEFNRKFPNVKLDLLLTERVVDLIGESIDVALRIGHLKDSTLIGRKLGTLDSQLVASPAYLRANGTPRVPEDLANHSCIGFAPGGTQSTWTLKSGTTRREVKPNWAFSSNHILAVKSAALNDLGIALVPSYVVNEEMKNKSLKRILPDWREMGIPLNIVFAGQKFAPPKLREFVRFLGENAHQLCRVEPAG